MAHPHDTPLPSYKSYFTPDLLKGKVAFVTGGGSGIGFRITEFLLRHGCNTVIMSRSQARVEEAAARLATATGGNCLAVAADVRHPEQIQAAVEQAMKKFGRIDILINNAAGNFLSPAAGLSPRAFKTVIDIDLIGTFLVSRAVFDAYMKDHGGVILNISATLHYKGDALQAHAGAAKAGIDALTKHFANEWGRLGVRVNGVAPGPIDDTEGFRRLGGFLPKEAMDAFIQTAVPIARLGTREDIANAILFLASDAASYVTGTTLIVDGGAWFRSDNSGMSEAMSSKL